jgi:hypothetical protein
VREQRGLATVRQNRCRRSCWPTFPFKVIGGVEYYEFRVDLNENNSSAGKLVSLNAFKFYTSASPEGEMAQLEDFRLPFSSRAGRPVLPVPHLAGTTQLSTDIMNQSATYVDLLLGRKSQSAIMDTMHQLQIALFLRTLETNDPELIRDVEKLWNQILRRVKLAASLARPRAGRVR